MQADLFQAKFLGEMSLSFFTAPLQTAFISLQVLSSLRKMSPHSPIRDLGYKESMGDTLRKLGKLSSHQTTKYSAFLEVRDP